MRRRDIAGLAGATVLPLAGVAQPTSQPVIGLLGAAMLPASWPTRADEVIE